MREHGEITDWWLPGGLGVVADDLAAGLAAAVVQLVVVRLFA